MVVNRFLKLNTDWTGRKWVAQLSDGAKVAWIGIQCHAKAHGMGGIVEAVDAWTIQQRYFISSEDCVLEAIARAIEHNALRCDAGTWILLNWDAEQGDPTGADRQKRWRDSRKEPNAEPGEPDRNGSNALRNASNAEEKRGEEKNKLVDSGESTNSSPGGDLSEGTGRKSRMQKGEFPIWWAKFIDAYPERAGGQSWGAARTKAVAKIKAGADPQVMLAKAGEFAEWCRQAGTFGTGRVPMPATWIHGERWLESYGDPLKAGVGGRSSGTKAEIVLGGRSMDAKTADITAEIMRRAMERGEVSNVA